MANRNLCEVIEKLLPLVEEGKDCQDASHALRKISESAGFTAPELMGIRWMAAQEVLVESIPDDHPKRAEIARIWNNVSDEPVETR